MCVCVSLAHCTSYNLGAIEWFHCADISIFYITVGKRKRDADNKLDKLERGWGAFLTSMKLDESRNFVLN